VSVDGLIGKEASTVLKVFAARTATKAGTTYSNVMRYMRATMANLIKVVNKMFLPKPADIWVGKVFATKLELM
jgi:hypothetical protein